MTENIPHLLLVDDDTQLAEMLCEYLELQGFTVDVASTGKTALEKIAKDESDLVILDVMLPDSNGFEILKKIRENRQLPVVMLTARGEEPDRILGLLHGADDYLPKPFNPLELTARIKAVLKRASSPRPENNKLVRTGPLELNLSKRECRAHGELLNLTAAEMNLLEQLMRHPDEVLSRSQLTELALNRPLEAYDRSIDTLISKLRNKLAEAFINRDCIRSLRGHGYVLDSEKMERTD